MRIVFDENLRETFENTESKLSREEQNLFLDILPKLDFKKVLDSTRFERDIREELKALGLDEAHYEELVEARKQKIIKENRRND